MSLGIVLAIAACGDKTTPREGQLIQATWYDVPSHSPTRARAEKGEFTAASNRFDLGTRVRVTRIGNGKSVVVRITDKLGSQKTGIDLSRAAAEELEMVSDGVAKVRAEALP